MESISCLMQSALSRPKAVRCVISVPPTNISVSAPGNGAANNCGHPANLSGPRLGANPLKLAGYPQLHGVFVGR